MTGERPLLIGEFARRCRLPVSTLRYYDRIGLLAPAQVDTATGYRRYQPSQLATAALIARLREAGVAPAQIEHIVAGGPAASVALLTERRRMAEELARGERRLAQLDDLLAEDDDPGYVVDVADLTAREVVALPFRAAFDNLPGGVLRAIARLRSMLRGSGCASKGRWGATLPLELGEQVSGYVFTCPSELPPGLDTAWLPATLAATTEHTGSVGNLALAYHAAFAEIDRRGARPLGPVIEEYEGLGIEHAARRIRIWVPFC